MSGTKKCAQCAEVVQMDAIVCRYCGYNFKTDRAAQPPKNSLQSCLMIVGYILLGLLVLLAISALAS